MNPAESRVQCIELRQDFPALANWEAARESAGVSPQSVGGINDCEMSVAKFQLSLIPCATRNPRRRRDRDLRRQRKLCPQLQRFRALGPSEQGHSNTARTTISVRTTITCVSAAKGEPGS